MIPIAVALVIIVSMGLSSKYSYVGLGSLVILSGVQTNETYCLLLLGGYIIAGALAQLSSK